MAGLSRLWEQLSTLHVMINQIMDWARAASPTRARPVSAPAPPLPAPAVALPQLIVPEAGEARRMGSRSSANIPSHAWAQRAEVRFSRRKRSSRRLRPPNGAGLPTSAGSACA